ncbi:peptide ABC transporter substrate-binding protein [uncultured Secundilactobacillus sp.]|uniref:peptide ABC transporter substrate-binding protein n=1 Tax=uncultured Secundilactobacillus sp. TaxID=2813935 RepID=UPI002584D91B|nr:peptide ABC transporter substrate-binding protein [uncultured Secundilactobacillus sp.]
MVKMKRLLVSMAAVAVAVSLGACGSKSAKQRNGNTLKLMQNTELLSLDNSNYADLTMWNVLENSMEGLYRQDADNRVAPAIATSVVKPTNNGKTYTFHLRKNAKWSNGDSVTAADFVNSWRRSASATSRSGYNYIFSGIKNADAISSGKLPATKLGVSAADKYTLKVELEHPMPYFSKMMILPAFFPQDTAAVKKYGKAYGTKSSKMVYNGPFQVTGWNGTNDSWQLKRNVHYYDKEAIHLNEIDMQVVKDANTAHDLFEKGELDDATITGVTAQGLQKDKNLQHVSKAGTYYARLNLKAGKTLHNKKLRQALSLALDRSQLTKKVLADGSTPAYTYVARQLAEDPTTGKDFATEMTPKRSYDVKKARQLWKTGLKEAGVKGQVTLQLLGMDATDIKNVSQFLQGELEKNLPNLKVEVRNIPSNSYNKEQASGHFDLEQTLWLADFGDPINFFSILTSKNPQNYGHNADKTFDAAVKAASSKNAQSEKNYWQNMRTAQRQLNNNMPVLPLYSMVESHLVNPKLTGVEYHPVGENDYTRASFK